MTKSKNSKHLLILITIVVSLIITGKALPTSPLGLDHEYKLSEKPKASLDLPLTSIQANFVVSQHGDGNFTTIAEAIEAAPDLSDEVTIIYVRSGTYEVDNLQVSEKKINIWLFGDGINKTIISGGRSVGGSNNTLSTFHTATFDVHADGFAARDITFKNWAGPEMGQAVALLIKANDTVVYRCSIEGFQDTLYVHSGRQFYRESFIYGTVDFIFGDATVVFQNCSIYARRPLVNQFNAITAQNRHDPDKTTGIVIHRSRILPAPDLLPVKNIIKTYLGRPWDLFSRVVYMSCWIEDHITPSGWTPWNNDTQALDKLYYGEYNNNGTGSAVDKRVNWPGFHNMTSKEAEAFTINLFINGSDWLPFIGVPFMGGL